MPYRHVPPLQRPRWEKLTGVWFACFVIMGVVGLFAPSRSLADMLGLGQIIFCLLLITLGASGLGAWWTGHRDPERWFMVALGALTLIHGASVWAFTGGGGAQTGIRLIAAGIGTLAWVGIRHEFGISRAVVEEAVSRIGENDDGRDRG